MKALLKLLIVDVILLVAAIILNSVPILGALLITATAILGTYTALEFVRIKKEEIAIANTPVEEQRRKLISEKLEKARAIAMSAGSGNQFIGEVEYQLSTFYEKEKALKTIIGLNEGGCGVIIEKNSIDVYETIVENYRRMSKRIVAYTTTRNSDIQKEIRKLIEANNNLLVLYNRLIDEVSRMGDNINEQDESLQNLIGDLQELRKRNESDDDDQDEENPFKLETFPPKE